MINLAWILAIVRWRLFELRSQSVKPDPLDNYRKLQELIKSKYNL